MAYKKKETPKYPQPDECYQYIDKKVEDAITKTTAWEQSQAKWHKLRMRIKKSKTSPFIGCSNIRMPTAEIKIRKLKAALVNTVIGIRPVVQAIPSPSGNMNVARKIEKFLDHLIMNVINITNKTIIAIDQELEKGFYLLKPYWRLEITNRIEELSLDDISVEEASMLYNLDTPIDAIKQDIAQRLEVDMSDWVAEDNQKEVDRVVEEILKGKEKVEFRLKDVLYNAPDVSLVSPERCFVPSDSPLNPQECEFVCHEFFMPWFKVKINAEEKSWNKDSVEAIEYWKGRDKDKVKDASRDETDVERIKSLREGIDRINSASEQVRIWEWYGWYDINDDGVPEKCVITTAPDFGVTLRKITLPFSNGKFPFVKLCYEITDDRWFSHRGIPELIEDIIKEIDVQHMQKIDSQTIRNAPMFVYRAGLVNPNTVKFIPGQGVPVQGMNRLDDTLTVLNSNNPNVEFSYEREQMLLETKVEELIGQVDFTLQSMINKRQPRTLGEVQMQQQNMQMVFSLDATMNVNAFSELFSMIWELWCDNGDDEYEFAYFGKDGWEKIKLSREEIQGKYTIVVRGNDQNTNSQVRMQKAQQVMMASANEMAIQMGVIKPHHLAEAYDLFYKELDIPEHQRLHEAPEQLFKEMQMRQQQPPPPEVRINAKDLTDAEMADVLKKKGIQPDAQGRGMKAMADNKEKNVDSLSKVASMIGDLQEPEPKEPKGA